MNPNMNYGLWVIMMCQCRSTDCNKSTILVSNGVVGGSVHVWRARSIWNHPVLCAQFCYEPKTAFSLFFK